MRNSTKQLIRRPPGRPRGYDPGQALDRVTGVFWDAGYSAASLDDISCATGMNRPSLYNAFGDKRALYLMTLGRYREMGRDAMHDALSYDVPFEEALRRVYRRALAIYLSGKHGARGCFLIGTAATEAVRDAKVRKQFADGLHELDEQVEARIRHALQCGEIKSGFAPQDLARLACAIMNSLALRARAGERRAQLEALAEAGVRLICGTCSTGEHVA
jgi:AcrR family transcriptional regulator